MQKTANNLQGTMELDSQGILHIGGINLEELAEKYGTPLLVMDEEKIRANLKEYINSFTENYPRFKVIYACKAFMNRTLCKIIESEGVGLDVVSGGELYSALQADFPAEKIFFHGNNKQVSEIELALQNKIGRFVVDNAYEAELINDIAAESGEKARAIIRIIPGIEAHTHEYIQTGQLDSKFGVSIAGNQALDLIKNFSNLNNLELKGLHAHIGSQIFNLEPYQRLIDVIFAFMDKVRNQTGKVFSELNLGGGLGISHISEEKPPAISTFIKTIATDVFKAAEKYGYPLPQLIVEPGRSIVGDAGTTLYKVGSIKQVPGMTKYVAVDGGMSDNIRPALYNASYNALPVRQNNDKQREEVTIAGKCCESGDILIKDIKMSALQPGDLLAVPATGAYTYAMANNYNCLPKPAVVLVKDGQANLIIKRETYDQLLENDVIPDEYL